MIINELTLCDFRCFEGRHDIALAPRTRYGAERSIVLFGGLNGAGKTTLLDAVRLVLYGKQSLGSAISVAEYHNYLRDSIHRGGVQLIRPDSAYVRLSFTYGKLGERTDYVVTRSWAASQQDVKEHLSLERDGKLLKNLTPADAQAFLNELIPLGVSDLFFFDGEKIAELAEDTSGLSLGDALRRLVGLDIVERLRTDLSVYVRQQQKSRATAENVNRLKGLEPEYESLQAKIERLEQRLDGELDRLRHLDAAVGKTELALSADGGDWAKGRDRESERLTELTGQLSDLEAQARALTSGLLPLGLGLEFLRSALDEGQAEQDVEIHRRVVEELDELMAVATQGVEPTKLRGGGKKLYVAIRDGISEIRRRGEDVEVGHGYSLGSREADVLRLITQENMSVALEERVRLKDGLYSVRDQFDEAAVRLGRAPDEGVLKVAFDEVKRAIREREEQASTVDASKRELRSLCEQAIRCVRELQRLDALQREEHDEERPVAYARGTRELLQAFSVKTIARKLKELEQEFALAFRRLARKEDLMIRARIDADTFRVTLEDDSGTEVQKYQLSAGEKQIFAIAMLEALSRTSGRKLPIIIDTPLGRLDSKHRTKLVEHYFPRASHQVLILSTDTEVDEQFYRALSPHVSHAFEIIYDPKNHSSTLKPGYFWRSEARQAMLA